MFRTQFKIPKSSFHVNHGDIILSIGSCFAQNMGKRMKSLKFDLSNNPFGIIYNPNSIAQSLEYIFAQTLFSKEDLFFHNDCWHSWTHHSSFSHPDINIALQQMNTALINARKTPSQLILTFGSAYAYKYRETNKVVANCHKIPNTSFDKIRLSSNEIAEAILSQIEQIRKQNNDLKTILTVSPIRHIKDGLIENQKSKAILLLACEQIEKHDPTAYYFPSYELMMDDLRDYRFYATDMLHPNQQAQDYIWEKFQDTLFDKNTQSTILDIHQLNQSLAHRPLQANTPSHQRFLQKLLEKIGKLEGKYPTLDFNNERLKVQSNLNQ